MKKILIIIAIGISISILVSCFSTEHYLIKGIKFYGVELTNPEASDDKDKYFIEVSDILKDKLYFEVFGESEYQYGYLNNVSLINECYATTVPEELDNYILIDSLELRFDSDIYFGLDTIVEGTDLWNHPLIKDYKWYYHEDKYNSSVYVFNFGFTESFYDEIVIPQKKYRIELTCKTSDNLTFNESIDIYLKIGK